MIFDKDSVMRKSFQSVVILLVIGIVYSFVAPTTITAASKMPAFELEDVMTGTSISSEAFKGKSLLVIFFATWCPPCIQEIPDLIKLHKKYGENGFSVVAFSVDQEKQVVQKLVERKEINYPVMMADKAVTKDFGGVYGIPTSFLVSKRGTVVKKYSGYVPHSVLVKDLEQILN